MPYVKIISGLNFYTKKSRIKSLINHVFELKPENEIFLGKKKSNVEVLC